MSRRSHGATARKIEPLQVAAPPPASGRKEAVAPWDGVEDTFFRRGEAGIVEPPVYLPYDSFLFPLLGVAFLAVLTALALQ